MVRNIGELRSSPQLPASGTPIEDDLLGPGEPDGFGYVWHDSNEPGGPEFNWVEISQIGTKLPLSRDGSEVVDLPFVFPFYGEAKTSIRISSHGYMTFGTKGDAWSNKPIPTEDEPNDLIAVYGRPQPPRRPGRWRFLLPRSANNRFIVEWNKVPGHEISHTHSGHPLSRRPNRIPVPHMTFGAYYYSAKGAIGIECHRHRWRRSALHTMGYIQNGLAEIAPSGLAVGRASASIAPGEKHDTGCHV